MSSGKFRRKEGRGVNKSRITAYNKVVEEILVSERKERSAYITYLYNALMGEVNRRNGVGELVFGQERTALKIMVKEGTELRARTRDKIAEIIGIGYKFEYFRDRLKVCLSIREKKLLLAALIAADFEGDGAYIRRKICDGEEYALDGFFVFRLAPLREKWDRIIGYIPAGFSSCDLKKFCDFLVSESKNKIYVKGKTVFGENLAPLRRSRLLGEEDIETEIILSDAGFVYCLGEVEDGVGDFLQKYYAERAIFS